MGDMLKLMQGGTDRTGFADMADQYAYCLLYTSPSPRD